MSRLLGNSAQQIKGIEWSANIFTVHLLPFRLAQQSPPKFEHLESCTYSTQQNSVYYPAQILRKLALVRKLYNTIQTIQLKRVTGAVAFVPLV